MNKKLKRVTFDKKIVILGFGCVGKATLPLILKHIDIPLSRLLILSKIETEQFTAKQQSLAFRTIEITEENYQFYLSQLLSKGDFLVNLSTGISSRDLIQWCKVNEVLYMDASTEPWDGLYKDATLALPLRTNYALRESILQLERSGPTAILTHGANPGLVSHFIKQALINLAEENKLNLPKPKTAQAWANLAHALDIKAIHIAERDSQISKKIKKDNCFFNTWSIQGLIAEAIQPAELGWGTHECHWPSDAYHHTWGSKCGIYLNQPGAWTKVRTWTPTLGATHGYLITHAEALSISHYLTIEKDQQIYYRPTVHYAYSPCSQTKLSLLELVERELTMQDDTHLMLDDITNGTDELGVLLMGNKKGAYWYGSQLTIQEAREIAPYNSATSLQVAAGIISAMIWSIEHPNAGILEPDEIDYEYILSIAAPYLGKINGYFTDWTPLQGRNELFKENLDTADPWQFINIRVS